MQTWKLEFQTQVRPKHYIICFKGIIHILSKGNVDGISTDGTGCISDSQWYPLNALSKMLITFLRGTFGNLHKTQERKRQTPISFLILHK